MTPCFISATIAATLVMLATISLLAIIADHRVADMHVNEMNG